MDELEAKSVAKALGGEAWQSGGNIWLVSVSRADGKLVVISDELVAEYESDAAFAEGRESVSIAFN